MTSSIDLQELSEEDIRLLKRMADFLRFQKKTKDNMDKFLELCGSWEDDRSPEEIVSDIYESRTTGQDKVIL